MNEVALVCDIESSTCGIKKTAKLGGCWEEIPSNFLF